MAKKIIIVGAGPGGLTAAMILSSRGFEVTVFEKQKKVGGRNAAMNFSGFTFDTGPTFLMMKFVLEEMFQEAGEDAEKYLKFIPLEPMYSLNFGKLNLKMSANHDEMAKIIEKNFPGNKENFRKFLNTEKRRFEKLYPCLRKDYSAYSSLYNKFLLTALPYLDMSRSMFDVAGDYFQKEYLKLAFSFQAEYLGMSPFRCPGAMAMIPYVEHAYGIYHVEGGLNVISQKMAEVAKAKRAKILLNTPVKELIIDNKTVKGVILTNGEKMEADEVIINEDFAFAMSSLVPEGILQKYSRENLRKKSYSCSTFMLYLGVDKVYDLPHHNIYFADDYRLNIESIFDTKTLGADNSFYMQNATITDSSLAPKGQSTIYVLVPAPNNSGNIDWQKEEKLFREEILTLIEEKTPLKDLKKHVVADKMITPLNWENDYSIYYGATFNLTHKLNQMLYFRPRNKFEELDNCYLVGGGTHPGSGLPTIYESARISANLICKKYGIPFTAPQSIPPAENQ